MDFWSDLSKTICSAADQTVKETEKLTAITKIKYKLGVINSKLDVHYKDLGELNYSQKCGKEVTEEMYEELYSQIDALVSEAELLEEKLADMRDFVACKKCGFKVKRGLSFCPQCGEKLADK